MVIKILTLAYGSIDIVFVCCLDRSVCERERECVVSAGGIKCYQCRTDQDEDCESGSLDDRHLEDCASALRGEGPFFCRSIHQILYFTENHDEAIIRECGSETFKRECYKAGWEDDSYQLSCDCRTDGCNSAHLTAASVTCWLSILVNFQFWGHHGNFGHNLAARQVETEIGRKLENVSYYMRSLTPFILMTGASLVAQQVKTRIIKGDDSHLTPDWWFDKSRLVSGDRLEALRVGIGNQPVLSE
uniref:Protein quiver n=1 Tax=Timema bartmani TaxID=61472 RepID=A0A7R9I4R7_9NEOP|nr:unnamed protein product [Timema bartmani]